MSTLQISLAIIGGLVLAGVVVYNAWVARQSAPRTAVERVQEGHGDASGFDDTTPFTDSDPLRYGQDDPYEQQRIDPVLDDAPQAVYSGAATAVGEGRSSPARAAPLYPAPQLERRAGLDALIDTITPLSLEGEVSGDALLAALPGTRRVGSKPFAVEGQSETTGEWETPRLGQRYRALQAGMQLANRSGALNNIEFSEFVVTVQALADAVGAAPDFPDMRAEVARGRELDAFASGHDAQLSFTLRARRAAWSPGYVAQQAARLGFVAGALPGRMVLPGSHQGQAPLLSLAFDPQAAMADDPEQSALREIVLSLEVTHVPRSEQPFVRMRQAAASLAEAMDGAITDDTGQLLSTHAMDHIGADLQSLYDALDSRDLAAGSPQARRLFS